MAVTLRSIVETRGLELTVIAGLAGLDRTVRWAHVSELQEPAPWLEGGELLLTTGIQLFANAASTRTYIRQLAESNVAALGLSTGACVTHQEVPAALIQAADEFELPLVHVPEAVPLEAIIRAVAHALEEERNEPMRRAFDAQRALTASVVSPGGVSGIVGALSAATRIWCVVCDVRGDELAASSAEARRRLQPLLPQLRDARTRGLRSATALVDVAVSSVILPLGVAGRVRGFLLAGKAGVFDPYDRILLASAASLLSLELERGYAVHEAARQQRVLLLEWLMKGPVPDAEAAARLAHRGIRAKQVKAVVIESGADGTGANPPPGELVELLEYVMLPARHPVLAQHRNGEVVALAFDPPPELNERLAEIVAGRHAGIGGTVSLGNVTLSIRQARRAAAAAQAQGVPVLELTSVHSYRALLELGDPSTLSAFADAILAPLDAHDQQARRAHLLPALREFLAHTGSAEAAAVCLGVHRHTLRQRLLRVEQVTGRSLEDARDRLELWLALEVRELVSAHTAESVGPSGAARCQVVRHGQ
ncbi:PucR family transcriptional regulator [Micromonospora sp. NPDC048830]|uniref:PucR family transcriptional regulator n=1 Tax=Micromonospora sp. NPDC048830 TaxID=3364257 RepID=UPI003718E68B